MIQLAAAAYPIETLPSWTALEDKLNRWCDEAATQGADLAVFPEYAGLEAALLGGEDPCARSEAERIRSVLERSAAQAEAYRDSIEALARRYDLYIVAGSLAVSERGSLYNRAYVAGPAGLLGWQDKCVLTPWERQNTPLQRGQRLCRFDLPWGRLGVLVCYDSEFPLLARQLDADLLAIPACTDTPAGQTRLQVAARARALEGQCIALHAPLLGAVPHCPVVDTNTGHAGIYGPPDQPFPDSGILAQGATDHPGWIYAKLTRADLNTTRERGAVSLRADWPASARCDLTIAQVNVSELHP